MSDNEIKLSDNCTVEPFTFESQENGKHPNESNESLHPTCDNCRHRNTPICSEFIRKKRYYLRKHGYKTVEPKNKTANNILNIIYDPNIIYNHTRKVKEYCVWWAYQPVGLWSK